MRSKVIANWTEASLHTAGETMRPLNEMSKDQTEGAPKPQLVKQLQSNVRTEPCKRRTHSFAHLLTLKILI